MQYKKESYEIDFNIIFPIHPKLNQTQRKHGTSIFHCQTFLYYEVIIDTNMNCTENSNGRKRNPIKL